MVMKWWILSRVPRRLLTTALMESMSIPMANIESSCTKGTFAHIISVKCRSVRTKEDILMVCLQAVVGLLSAKEVPDTDCTGVV